MIEKINNKSRKYILNLILSVILVSLLILPYNVTAVDTISSNVEVDEIFELIKNNHVSGISESKLADAAIEGMLNTLDDPYTQYFSKSEWEAFEDSLERNYVGVGIRVGEDESGFYVAEVFLNSPAQLAGILKGDYIISADGVLMKGKTITELVNMISGPAGSTVKVTISREQKPITFTITRQKITVPNVTHKTFSEGTGYIRISSFSSDADEAFTAQLAEMNKSGITSLVLDLRDNPGGYLDTTANMAKHFIQEGILIHTKDRNSIDNPVKVTGGTPLAIPIVVLVNENSASASEVLTGFLQDYNLAKVVGTLTYGKGSVQNVFPLTNGGALKITIQEYLTPKLRKVNHVGLKPNIEVQSEAAQLITALQTAGMKNTRLIVDKNSLSINGIDVLDTFKVIRAADKIYVPARVLAALTQTKVSWNAASKAVQISDGSVKALFASATGLKVDKALSYIELNSFKKSYPQLQWSQDGDKIILNVKE